MKPLAEPLINDVCFIASEYMDHSSMLCICCVVSVMVNETCNYNGLREVFLAVVNNLGVP